MPFSKPGFTTGRRPTAAATAVLACVAVVAALAGAPAAAGESDWLAQGLYDRIIAQSEEYRRHRDPKALIACIRWGGQQPEDVRVLASFASATGEGSDGPIFSSHLVNSARHRCETWKETKNADCACQTVDMNGKNMLEVPAIDLAQPGLQEPPASPGPARDAEGGSTITSRKP